MFDDLNNWKNISINHQTIIENIYNSFMVLKRQTCNSKYAAYDSYSRLGLANSERIVCQITSDSLKKSMIGC